MLTADQQTKNLGVVKFGSTKEFSFTVTNNFEHYLKLGKISKSCNSCTEAEFAKDNLAPGESTDINVKFTPGSTGLASKGLTIIYEVNGMGGSLGLTFKAQVNG